MSIFTRTNRPKSMRHRASARATVLQLESLEARCLLSSASLPTGGVDHLVAVTGSGSTLFALSPQNDLYRHTDTGGWTALGHNVLAGSASAETSGNVVVFALTSDHALSRFDAVSGWQLIGAPGTIQSISSGTDQNGRADVFVLSGTGAFMEYTASSGWLSGAIGAPGTILSWDATAGDTVVAVTTSHQIVEHNDQFGWFPLSGLGFAQSVSVATDTLGNQVVFASTPGQGLYQYVSGGAWTPIGSAGTIAAVSAGLDTAGNAMAAVLTTANDLLEYDGTSGWFLVHPPGPVAQASAATMDRIYFTLQDGSVFGHDDQFGSFRMTSIGFAQT